jgi:phosphatidylserine decarboxylase
MAYPANASLSIKGKSIYLHELMGGSVDGLGGLDLAIVSRLAVHHYHRVHSPVDGVVTSIRHIDGYLLSVDRRRPVTALLENRRVVIMVEGRLGPVVVVAVGATCVGGIQLAVKPGQHLARGTLLGYFQFGGSTVVTVVSTARFGQVSPLLRAASYWGVETELQQGGALTM